jgi:hypothetical protein
MQPIQPIRYYKTTTTLIYSSPSPLYPGDGDDDARLGSVGQLLALNPADGKDWCDNVLLEYELALAMQEHAAETFKVMPIMLGRQDDRGYTAFPFGTLDSLSTSPSLKTKEALVHHCRQCGIPLSEVCVHSLDY